MLVDNKKDSVSIPAPAANFLQGVFSEVAGTYERINHILTLGLDRVWRQKAARIAASSGGSRWVDMCTGTGEMAVYLSRLAPRGTKIMAVDFSSSMLAQAAKKPEARRLEFISADIHALPFASGSMDLATMSFATRNINLDLESLIHGFTEIYRVLRPGGTFVNLETSQPVFGPARKIFHLYVKLFVRQLGSRLSGSGAGYAYLSKTIPRFYPAEVLSDILAQAGFGKVIFKRLMFGAAAIHQATKE